MSVDIKSVVQSGDCLLCPGSKPVSHSVCMREAAYLQGDAVAEPERGITGGMRKWPPGLPVNNWAICSLHLRHLRECNRASLRRLWSAGLGSTHGTGCGEQLLILRQLPHLLLE